MSAARQYGTEGKILAQWDANSLRAVEKASAVVAHWQTEEVV